MTLRKGGPRDYGVPKSYRAVALIGTLAKLLEAVVATRIMYTAEEHRLLPDTHLGTGMASPLNILCSSSWIESTKPGG